MSRPADNTPRWQTGVTGHYEVWYLTGNDPASGVGWWIRYTLEAPVSGPPYAQLWFAHFDAADPSRTFAFNKKYPIDSLSLSGSPLLVQVGNSELGDNRAAGEIECAEHRARWDLSWTPAPATLRQLPPVFYLRDGLGDTTVLTPNPDIAVSGTIEVDGRTYELFAAPFGQTHLWGKKHAHAWAWGHCNAFKNHPGATLETLTAVLHKGGRTLPALTVVTLWLDGEVHRWNTLLHAAINRSDFGTGYYRFSTQGLTKRLVGEYSCHTENMVEAPYEDPDGEPAYCANTEVADLRVTLYDRAGPIGPWRERERLVAPGAGHFEVGGRQRDRAIGKAHYTI